MAFGRDARATGDFSTAIGNYVSTNSHEGAVVIGDNSTTSTCYALADNQYVARFDNGYRCYTNAARTAGMYALHNAGSWSSISDSTKKEGYQPVDGESFLTRFRLLRLGSWNYRGQDPSLYRHYGPMAQEWFSAFGHDGIGTIGNDTTLASADVDGILCIAIQALEKRTRQLRASQLKVVDLEQRLEAMEKKVTALRADLSEIDQLRSAVNCLQRQVSTDDNKRSTGQNVRVSHASQTSH